MKIGKVTMKNKLQLKMWFLILPRSFNRVCAGIPDFLAKNTSLPMLLYRHI